MDAFAAVFEGFRPDVFRVACRLVGVDEANDVVMETFLKAWQAIPRFDGRSALKTWLYRITHNSAIDMLRSRQQRRETVYTDLSAGDGAMGEIVDKGQKAPDEIEVEKEIVLRVSLAMDRLPSEHRISLALRYSDGLSYSEIASVTGVSIGTVMSRLFNGKRKLRRILEESVS